MSDALTPSDKPGDPADKAADGAFGGVHSHRAGYGDDKLQRVMNWLRERPLATLASGEGGLLLAEIDRLHVRNRQIDDEVWHHQWQIERLKAAIARVRALHVSSVRAGFGECDDCRDNYPCSTLRALEGDA